VKPDLLGAITCPHLIFFSLLLFASWSFSFVCSFTAGFRAIHLALRSGQLQVRHVPPPELDCLWSWLVFIRVFLFLYFLKTHILAHNGNRSAVAGHCPPQLFTHPDILDRTSYKVNKLLQQTLKSRNTQMFVFDFCPNIWWGLYNLNKRAHFSPI